MNLETEIQNILDNIALDAEGKSWGDREWTKQIKSRLAGLGRKYKYWVYASQAENIDGGEWLFDLTWLNYSGNNLINVELALESEWNTNSINDDFQKLLLARAELRVMIFQSKNVA